MMITAKEASGLSSMDYFDRECVVISEMIRTAARSYQRSLTRFSTNKKLLEALKTKFEILGFKVSKVKVFSEGREGNDYEITISWE